MSQHRKVHGGVRADLGFYVRSAWEANYARMLNWRKERGEVVRWEYEPETFEFPIKRGNRSYIPDFKVWYPDGHYEWHEVKGYMDAASKTKLKRFAKYYPNEKLVLIDSKMYRAMARVLSGIIPNWETYKRTR